MASLKDTFSYKRGVQVTDCGKFTASTPKRLSRSHWLVPKAYPTLQLKQLLRGSHVERVDQAACQAVGRQRFCSADAKAICVRLSRAHPNRSLIANAPLGQSCCIQRALRPP